MTMRDVVLLAGGVTEDADLTVAEIARRAEGADPGTLATSIRVPFDSTFRAGGNANNQGPLPQLGAGGVPDVALKPYDNVLIMRQTGWELQRLVYLTGQVKHPGRYALRSKTERVGDLIRRAGGLTEQAYAGGVQFYRSYTPGRNPVDGKPPEVRAEPRSSRDSLPRGFTERVGLDLPRALKNSKFRDNIILAAGDSIHIPEYNPIVIVEGTVNSPGAVPYTPGKSLDWYVDAAGGYTQLSDSRHAYVTQPNGKREAVKRRVILADGVPRPKSGAVIFVPAKVIQEQPPNVAGVISTVAQVLTALVTVILVAKQ
jgi:protein involved in polysaccharide export with SLBB domain